MQIVVDRFAQVDIIAPSRQQTDKQTEAIQMIDQTIYILIVNGQYAGAAATEGQIMEIAYQHNTTDYIIREETIHPYN